MSPALAFQKIISAKPRSIILSSGTMGDFSTWEKYLNVNFKYQTRIKGFINSSQLYSMILSKSSSNYPFEFSYLKKDSDNQHRELTEELKNL